MRAIEGRNKGRLRRSSNSTNVVALATILPPLLVLGTAAFAAPPGGVPMSSAPTPSAIDDGEEGGWSAAISDKMKDSISAATARFGMNKPPGPAPLEAPSGCPTITLLPGTESQRIMTPGATGNLGLKYQYTLATVGRECVISGDRV